MRLFLIEPVVPADADTESVNARLRACVDPIAELILTHVASDPALFAVRYIAECSDSSLPPTRTYGYANIAEIADSTTLLKVIKESLDPFSGKFSDIRSLVTCRAVHCGFDGQAFLCLPSDETVVESPDPTHVSVVDKSPLLLETDWMDGLLGP